MAWEVDKEEPDDNPWVVETEEPDTPAPTARRGTLRGAAPYVAGDAARQQFAATDPRRVDLPSEDQTTSILDKPSAAVRDPLLRPEFIDAARQQLAAVPEADRLNYLRATAQGTTVQARAARALLPEIEAENAAAADEIANKPVATGILARARQAGGGGGGPVAVPDLAPSIGELAANPGMPVDDRNPARLAAASQLQAGARNMAAADSSPKAFADRAELLARDFKAEAFAKENPHLASLMSGGGQMAAGLVNSVPTMMDFAARLVNKDISRAPNAPGVDDWTRTANSLMPAVGRQDMDKAWDKGEFAPWAVTNLIAQAPQVAGSVLAAFMPALRPFVLPLMGAQSAGQSFQQGDSSLGAALKGGAEIIGEKASFGVFDKIGESLARLPVPMRGRVLAAIGKSLPARGAAVSAQFIAGAVEESVTQVLQNGVDKYVEGKAGTKLLDGVGQAAVLGGFMEGPMAIPGALRGITRSREMTPVEAMTEALRTGQTRAAPAPRVEDMPTTPFTPEQIATMAATMPPAPEVSGQVGTKAQAAGSEQPVPGTPVGVAAVKQGSLADMVDQQMRSSSVQPNVAVPAGSPAVAGDARGDQPGGSVGAVGPVPAEPTAMGPGPAAPAASGRQDQPAAAADVPRPALEGTPGATVLKEGGFGNRSEAMVFLTNEGIGRRVDIVDTPDGKVALQPRAKVATEQTLQEDDRELQSLNAAITKDGWKMPDGSPVVVRTVPDKQAPAWFVAARTVAEAAWGIRVIGVTGTPGEGVQYSRRAYVNLDQAKGPQALVGTTFHEGFHYLEVNDPKAAKAFYDGVSPFLRAGVVGKQLAFENANLSGDETPLTEAGARSEVMANLNGATLLRSDFWSRVYDLDNGSTFRKVVYAFMKQATKLIRVARGSKYDIDTYVTERDAVLDVVAKVWADRAKSKGGTAAPVDLGARAAQKRAEKRQPGESDKAFAKRVVDVREAPATLPEKPDRYFKRPAGTQDMKVSRLISSKTDEENKQGGDNGAKRMVAAAAGELGKRDPITVMPSAKAPGSFDVVDGNGTLTTVKKYGWSKLPVVVVSREEGLAAIAEDKRKDKIKKNGWVLFDKGSGTKGIPRADMPQVSTALRPDLYAYLKDKFGIASKYERDVPASSLKPTQAEYSRKKVDELLGKTAEPPSESATKMHVLMSKDNFILDGHHRTEARREDGGSVDGIRFDANIDELMQAVWSFPFTKVNMESEGLLTPAAERPKLSDARLKKIDEMARAAEGSASEKSIKAAVDTLQRFEGVPPVDIPVDTRNRLEKMLVPLIATAAEENPAFNVALTKVAEDNGWRPLTAPTKSLKRSVEKMYEDERWHPKKKLADSTWLKDAVRGSIVVRDESEVAAAIEAVQKAFKVARIKDRFDKPLDSGYRDVLINVELPSGQLAELQIHIPQMMASKELGHLMFEIERAMAPGADRVRLAQAARALYGSAYSLAEETRLSNSSRSIGMPSLETRAYGTAEPVQPDKQRPSGSNTAGLPSTSANVVPGGSLDQSGAISGSPSDTPSLPRQARKAPVPGAPKPEVKKRLRPGQRLHQNMPDPAIAQRIAKQLGLSPQEVAATSLSLATGKGKGDAFSVPAVGGIPSTVVELTRRRTESGLRDLDTSVEADREVLARLMAAETLAAINAEGSAVEWYDATINRMLAMASVKYPELASDQDARNSFIIAMAITSQGLNVENNLGFAMRQYEAYRNSSTNPEARRFPIASEGKNGKPMENNFKVANGMIERVGLDKFRRMLRTEFTVGELKKAGWKIGGEKMGENVLGSSIFGPKIGFGFYSNLSGNFEPVTMDMWFMRTIGRLANALRSFDAKKFKAQTDRFLAGIDERGTDALYADSLDPDMVEAAKGQVEQTDSETGEPLLDANGGPVMGPDGDAIEALARAVNKLHQAEFKNRREEFNAGTRVKSELVKASETILKSLDKPRDSPGSGGERQDLRDIVRRTVDLVQKAYGKRIPPAALQALIWYPEQELYRNLGVSLSVTSQDYAGAIRKRLESEGFDGQQLTAAESRSRKAQRLAGKPEGEVARRAAGQSGGAGQLAADERASFLAETTPAPKVRAKKGAAPKQSRYAGADSASSSDYSPGDYSRLEGRTVERSITLDDGRTATMRMDAAQAMRVADERIDSLERLKKCIAA